MVEYIVCDRDKVGPWEKFKIKKVSKNEEDLKYNNNKGANNFGFKGGDVNSDTTYDNLYDCAKQICWIRV